MVAGDRIEDRDLCNSLGLALTSMAQPFVLHAERDVVRAALQAAMVITLALLVRMAFATPVGFTAIHEQRGVAVEWGVVTCRANALSAVVVAAIPFRDACQIALAVALEIVACAAADIRAASLRGCGGRSRRDSGPSRRRRRSRRRCRRRSSGHGAFCSEILTASAVSYALLVTLASVCRIGSPATSVLRAVAFRLQDDFSIQS